MSQPRLKTGMAACTAQLLIGLARLVEDIAGEGRLLNVGPLDTWLRGVARGITKPRAAERARRAS
jgi:hypothetical protein